MRLRMVKQPGNPERCVEACIFLAFWLPASASKLSLRVRRRYFNRLPGPLLTKWAASRKVYCGVNQSKESSWLRGEVPLHRCGRSQVRS
jgi:hypothetical protein